MNLDLSLVPTLWYENEKGERFVPTVEDMERSPDPEPEGFVYQHSQFPSVLRLNVLKSVVPAEVAACEHPAEDVHKTYGLIEGMEGRECKRCKGSQVKKIDEPWSDVWDAHGSRSVMSGDSSWPEDLVLEMARPRWFGWLRGRKTYKLGEAILIAANTCERCLNVLGHRYGLSWGYAEGSEEWTLSSTECQFCKGLFFSGGEVGR